MAVYQRHSSKMCRYSRSINKENDQRKTLFWLTEEIKKQMNDRDGLLRKARRSKNHNDWIRHKTFKNRVNNVIKRAKSKYHKNLLDENISKSILEAY